MGKLDVHQDIEIEVLKDRIRGCEKALRILSEAMDDIQKARREGELLFAIEEGRQRIKEFGYLES